VCVCVCVCTTHNHPSGDWLLTRDVNHEDNDADYPCVCEASITTLPCLWKEFAKTITQAKKSICPIFMHAHRCIHTRAHTHVHIHTCTHTHAHLICPQVPCRFHTCTSHMLPERETWGTYFLWLNVGQEYEEFVRDLLPPVEQDVGGLLLERRLKVFFSTCFLCVVCVCVCCVCVCAYVCVHVSTFPSLSVCLCIFLMCLCARFCLCTWLEPTNTFVSMHMCVCVCARACACACALAFCRAVHHVSRAWTRTRTDALIALWAKKISLCRMIGMLRDHGQGLTQS
jgi:hypothetical protein